MFPIDQEIMDLAVGNHAEKKEPVHAGASMRTAHHDHRAPSLAHERLRDGPEEKALEAGMIVSADDENVGAYVFGELRDFRDGIAHGKVRGHRVPTLFAQGSREGIEVILGFLDGVLVRRGRTGACAIEPAGAKHVGQVYRRVGSRPGEASAHRDDARRLRRRIDGDEDDAEAFVGVVERGLFLIRRHRDHS